MMMKKIFYIGIVALLGLAACNNQPTSENRNEINTDLIKNPSTASDVENENVEIPEFEFVEEVYNFGEIAQGEKIKTEFKFKNIGAADLLITDAKGSCGCTVPSFPEHPIAPGEEGVIKVVFDSNGKQGKQHKTVTLIANTQPNTKVLALKGTVLTPNNQ